MEQVKSFHTRPLPSSVISFTSEKSQELLYWSLQQKKARIYFQIAQQYITQDEPAYCGIATLCMILNAANIDPQRIWKGVWRWFDQAQLNCCRTLESIAENGITMAEFVCLARCNGLAAHAKTREEGALTIDKFRSDVIKSCESDATFLAVSFGRKILGQTGSGHFSPIAAFATDEQGEDWILILDVARFKYPAYWCRLELMWQAMDTVDDVSGLKRGWVILFKEDSLSHCSSTSVTAIHPVVHVNMTKLRMRVLLARCEGMDLELESFLNSDIAKDYEDAISFVKQDGLSTQDCAELQSMISTRQLFAISFLEFVLGHTLPMADQSGPVRETIDFVKATFQALRSCCDSEDERTNNRKCCAR